MIELVGLILIIISSNDNHIIYKNDVNIKK